MLLPILDSAWLATHAGAPAPVGIHHSMAPWPPNDVKIAASAAYVWDRDPGGPPWVRCSYVHPAAAIPCNSFSEVRGDLRVPRRLPSPPCMPRNASLAGLARRGVFPQNNSTSKCSFVTQ